MSIHNKPWLTECRTTLNDLKGQRYALNMQLLLAIQNHDSVIQAKLEVEIQEVDKQIDRMLSGCGTAGKPCL